MTATENNAAEVINPSATETDEPAAYDQPPEYTVHQEPPEQGGLWYRRCISCGIEAIFEIPWRNVRHPERCEAATEAYQR